MKVFNLLLFCGILLLFSCACNTLYNTKLIDIEIVEPGKVKFPKNYRSVAVRYNNCNVAPNPYFKNAFFVDKAIIDHENTDSIASKIYFEHFINELKNQDFFDTVRVIESKDYSKIKISDTITHKIIADFDSILKNDELTGKLNVSLFSRVINQLPNNNKALSTEQFLHPQLALYQPEELQDIADSTNADLLISFDFFSSVDGISHNRKTTLAKETVLTNGYWSFYDLNKLAYRFAFNKMDTIFWQDMVSFPKGINKVLPPRRDAVFNAADMAGTNFANFLVPHWIKVQRMYYSSGHIELKQTDELLKNGKWMEAANIWKANSTNTNKSIAAKNKFNMGLVCEMNGNIEAAIQWVVESFHVLGQDNKVHFINCVDYIRILSQRKLDIKLLEDQLESVN